jgi:2-methylisocitrate lyase-like PEP mutase family enzyme
MISRDGARLSTLRVPGLNDFETSCGELIACVVAIPVLMDGDTGFGNFNHERRKVRQLGRRGIEECA